jgi:hypothetical protein
MLKTIALAGIFIFTSAVSTAAVTSASQKKVSSTTSAPTAPQPKGFCFPAGSPC